MKKLVRVAICISLLIPCALQAQTTYVITDFNGQGTGTTTWTRENVYILDGPVYVNDGDVLTIQSGTVIKGRYSEKEGQNAMLIVANGGAIRANGTASLPIIFTSQGDNLNTIGNSTCTNAEVTYISDLPFTYETNGWGPVERDTGNGERDPGDGGPLSINGKIYDKGLGVHASDPDPPNPSTITDTDISRVRIDLAQNYDVFKSDVGPDDFKVFEESLVSIEFVVVVDGEEKFRSGVMRSGDRIQYVEVDVSGANTLELQILNGGSAEDQGDGNLKKADHGIWGGARLEACGQSNSSQFLIENIDPSVDDKGLWGGLAILGNARVNAPVNQRVIAGLDDEDEGRNRYGSTAGNLGDNAGFLRYVSIRHAGGVLSGNIKANALTLAGVGNGTTIEHIDVFASGDDGIEICGGTVNAKWMSMAFCEDDGFDIDQGYQGKGQFWFSIHNKSGDVGGSNDGGNLVTALPLTLPQVFNATFLGPENTTSNNRALLFADGAAGKFTNSIFADFAAGAQARYAGGINDSYARFENKDLQLQNNIFWEIEAGTMGPQLFTLLGSPPASASDNFAAHFDGGGNIYNNPVFRSMNGNSRQESAKALFPLPETGGFAYQDLASYPSDGFFENVGYKGAFGQEMWLTGWSALESYGFLGTNGGNDNPNTLKPDLTVDGYNALQTPVEAGQSISLENLSIINIGSFKAGATTVRMRLEGNNQVVTSQPLPALGKGESALNITLTVTLPENISGNQALIVEIDPADQVKEEDENNNSIRLPFSIDQQLPDVTLSNLIVDPGATTANTSVTLNFDVENKGGANSGQVNIRILMDGTELTPAPAPIVDIPPNTSGNFNRVITIPAGTSAGSKTLTVVLDPSNTIEESDETNNEASVNLEVLELLPDLVLSALSASVSSIEAGELFNLIYEVRNIGDAPSGPVDLLVRLSSEEVLASEVLPSLTTNETRSNQEIEVAIPPGTDAGPVTIEVILDFENKIIEQNEGNNRQEVELDVTQTVRLFPDLTLDITLPLRDSVTVVSGNSFGLEVQVANAGDTTALANTIRLSLNAQEVGTISQPALTIGSTASYNRSITIPQGTPAGFYQFIAKVDAGKELVEKDEGNNSDTLIVFVKETPSGLSITDFTFPPYHTMGESNTSMTSITVSNPNLVDKTEFFFKPISASLEGSSFQSIELNSTTEVFSADFSDANVGPIGISFYFKVTSQDGAEISTELGHTHLRFTGDGLTLPPIKTGSTVENYQILSIPLQLTNSSVNDVYVDDLGPDQNNTLWRLMQFNGSRTVDFRGTLPAGKSIWLLTVNSATIDTGPGTTVDATETEPFVIRLTNEHTQIGNPYNFPILWEDILAANDNPDGLTLSTFNRGYQEDNRLEAFEGGFIQANSTPIDLEIPVFKNPSVNRISAGPTYPPLDAPNWYVPFYLESGNMIHRIGGVGMKTESKEGYDIHDVSGLPRFDSYLDFHFPDKGHPFDRIAKNFVDRKDQYTWDMEIASSLGEAITVSWPNEDFGENEAQLWLEEIATSRVVNMREESSFTFYPQQELNAFRVHYGDLNYVQQQVNERTVWVGQPYPNPFSDKVSIPVFLSPEADEGKVEFQLFDVLGKEVGHAIWENPITGSQVLKWSMNGKDLSPGIYIYRVQFSGGRNSPIKQGRLELRR